ncbi:MAG: hypothetical protein ABSE05_11595 [Syntrophales bacterium]|jgi:hypothetical protein
MQKILKWQYDQLIKELLLLQEHQADTSCPCESGGEMCVHKHLMEIEAYAQETIPMEHNREYRKKLEQLENEAREFRINEEVRLRNKKIKYPFDPVEWPRKWRKEFEAYSVIKAPEAKERTTKK